MKVAAHVFLGSAQPQKCVIVLQYISYFNLLLSFNLVYNQNHVSVSGTEIKIKFWYRLNFFYLNWSFLHFLFLKFFPCFLCFVLKIYQFMQSYHEACVQIIRILVENAKIGYNSSYVT